MCSLANCARARAETCASTHAARTSCAHRNLLACAGSAGLVACLRVDYVKEVPKKRKKRQVAQKRQGGQRDDGSESSEVSAEDEFPWNDDDDESHAASVEASLASVEAISLGGSEEEEWEE